MRSALQNTPQEQPTALKLFFAACGPPVEQPNCAIQHTLDLRYNYFKRGNAKLALPDTKECHCPVTVPDSNYPICIYNTLVFVEDMKKVQKCL